MDFKKVDSVALSKVTSLLDNVSCYECCRAYITPGTAQCGHTLCHVCWGKQKTCPLCNLPVDRKLVKPNLPLQKMTGNAQALAVTFEYLFNIKLDELDVVEPKDDPSKNVKEWLASSQNHFSAPAQSFELSSQESKQNSNVLEISSSKIQVHTTTKKTMSPEKVIHVSTPQDDWDKIETIPIEETETLPAPFYGDDDNEYTANNPRRSSRKRELKSNDSNLNTKNNNPLKQQIKGSEEVGKKMNNSKQNWNNVKKMRKELSKLNKTNRNKLNVSIDICKKKQNSVKTNVSVQHSDTVQPQVYEIDESTPSYFNTKAPTNVIDIVMPKVTPENCTINDDMTNSNHSGIQSVLRDESKNLSHENLHDVCHDKTKRNKENSSLTTTKPGKIPFYKRSVLYNTSENVHVDTNVTKYVNNIQETNSNSNDDIKITIKMGNKITTIVIRKNNDVQLKVTTDKEVQTALCPLQNDSGNISSQTIEDKNLALNIDNNSNVNIKHKKSKEELKKTTLSSLKSALVKKNTSSAVTGSAQFEITESVEKELSNIMECTEIIDQNRTKNINSISPKIITQRIQTPNPQIASSQRSKTQKLGPEKSQKIGNYADIQEDIIDYLNDVDIFESDNITETPVQNLKNVKGTSSEILIQTACNKNKTQKNTVKRSRKINDVALPTSKKQKFNNDITEVDKNDVTKHNKHQPDSEPLNYDAIMGKVFASIDADMEGIKSQTDSKEISDYNATDTYFNKEKITQNLIKKQSATVKNADNSTPNKKDLDNQKESENIFSVCVDKDDVIEASSGLKKDKEPLTELQPNMEDFLTPLMSRRNQESESAAPVNANVNEIVHDDSESIVEDTPQKNTSFGKFKQKSTVLDSSKRISARRSSVRIKNAKVLNISNTVVNRVPSAEMKNLTDNNITVETAARKRTLETPLNINKFVDQIEHNSTPKAKKSLSFQNDNLDDMDPEQTLCPTNAVADTTQEKELMRKAFENTPTTQIMKPLSRVRCIAGSCLSAGNLDKLKLLCKQHKWSYVEKYTKELTHLVVGVDEENKAQRSVKYMCALAASKWIITFDWVEKCLQTRKIVSEDIYEALDCTGEPGPRRSRVATNRLFQGITFYCMEPFNILHVDTLKEMLESSGARVVSDVKQVKVTDETPGPAILLAEPADTQEDRCLYLAMQLSIVPVNYEWVLNCLGCYTLFSIQELLLCPFTLLPKVIASWPEHLIARENDENE